jgi:hypothetical protein
MLMICGAVNLQTDQAIWNNLSQIVVRSRVIVMLNPFSTERRTSRGNKSLIATPRP